MLTESELARWRKLFDPRQTSVQEFLESFKIKTDAAATEGENAVAEVQFKLRPVQKRLLDKTLAAWKRGRAARFRIPKSRGQGISSFWMAFLGFERVLRVPGYEFTAVGQGQDESEEHLDRLSEFYAQIPRKVLRALGIVRLRGTRKQFIFRHGGRLKSRVTVKTARKQGLGRGGQNNAILTTERPHWPAKSKKDLSGLTGRCQNIAGNVIVDESTAMGFDDFYEDCMAARDGRGGGFELFFIASHEKFPQNYDPLEGEERAFEETIGLNQKYGGAEETLVVKRVAEWWRSVMKASEAKARTLALYFLNWRRQKIDADFKHVNVFHREEPTFLDEAFQGYGRLVFPADLMDANAEPALQRRLRALVGSLETRQGDRVFTVQSHGPLVVYEKPIQGEEYAFGADVASGELVHASGGDEADFSTIKVVRVSTGEAVARFRAHIYPRPFAREVLRLAAWYNGAQGLVEANNHGGTVITCLLEDEIDIDGLRGADILLTTERLMKTDSGPESVKQYGWMTTSRTKPFLASAVVDFLSEWGLPENRGGASALDMDTLREMLRFVYNERGGMEAETGHDDLVIAYALSLVARKMVHDGAPRQTRIERPVAPNMKSYYDLFKPRGNEDEWKPAVGPDGKYTVVRVPSAAGNGPGDPGFPGY